MTYEELIKKAVDEGEEELDLIVLDELSRFPYEIFDINSLEILLLDDWLSKFKLSENDFNNLPKLKKLRNLSFIGNSLEFFPRQIGALENLEHLIIFHNKIRKIPFEITQCKKMKSIDISSNLITEFPEFLLGLKNLETLEIGGNPIKCIPRNIYLLRNLKSLGLSYSNLTSLPIELLKLDLEEFDISDTLLDIVINDEPWEPMRGNVYIRRKLEFYFDEFKKQLKRRLKTYLSNNQINKVLKELSSEIPELSYYNIPKDVIMISSRYRHVEVERRRGTINFENEKLELNKLIASLIDIVEEL